MEIWCAVSGVKAHHIKLLLGKLETNQMVSQSDRQSSPSHAQKTTQPNKIMLCWRTWQLLCLSDHSSSTLYIHIFFWDLCYSLYSRDSVFQKSQMFPFTSWRNDACSHIRKLACLSCLYSPVCEQEHQRGGWDEKWQKMRRFLRLVCLFVLSPHPPNYHSWQFRRGGNAGKGKNQAEEDGVKSQLLQQRNKKHTKHTPKWHRLILSRTPNPVDFMLIRV